MLVVIIFLPVPGVIRIKWSSEKIAALVHVVLLTELFGARFGVVVARTQRRKPIEGRERLGGRALFAAILRDRRTMVDRLCRNNFTDLKTRLAERVLLQLKSAHALPTLRGIRPNGHRFTFRL